MPLAGTPNTAPDGGPEPGQTAHPNLRVGHPGCQCSPPADRAPAQQRHHRDYGSASRTHYDDPNDIYPDGGELEEEPPQQMPVVKQTLSLAAEAFARQQDIARFDDHGSEELHCLP